jgi:hypothetical protein
LWECLPDKHKKDIQETAEMRDQSASSSIGARVFQRMQDEGYDFRRIARINTVSGKNDELFELWKGDNCIARLHFSSNGESKMVKVL